MMAEKMSSTKFGLSQIQLTQIMDFGDKRGTKKVDQYGGVVEIGALLHSNFKEGLSSNETELQARKKEFGVNYIEPIPPKSFLALMLDALNDKVLLILLACGILSIILNLIGSDDHDRPTAWVDGFAILMAVAIVVLVTAINDYTKEQQFRDLQKKLESTSKYTLLRDGVRSEFAAAEIVVGDVLEFKYGNTFPCDGLLIQGNDVAVSESSLTGETENIRKKPEKDPFMYAGTQVMEGTGTMLVIAVGAHSQQGIIFSLMAKQSEEKPGLLVGTFRKVWSRIRRHREPVKDQESFSSDGEEDVKTKVHVIPTQDEEENKEIDDEDDEDVDDDTTCLIKFNPKSVYQRRKKRKQKAKLNKKTETSHGSVLQKKLTKLALQIGYFGMAAAIISIVVTVLKFSIEQYGIEGRGWRGTDGPQFLRFFINGLTVLVVAIPEGLPLAVTIALAFSVKKMLKDNNLVRHLHSCETMGNATCICSDKTGTLTTNRMTVVDCYIAQMRYNGIPPTLDDLPPIAVEVLQQNIAINSGYSSQLQRPDEGGECDDSSFWKKITGWCQKKNTNVETNKEETPPTIEELLSLLHGEGGKLVNQVGNSTECALLGLLIELGIHYDPIRDNHPKDTFIKQFTFNSKRKSMSTVIPLPDNKGYRLLTKGASEIILSKCTHLMTANGTVVPLTEEMQQDIRSSVVRNMASNALRTICLAYRDISEAEIQPMAQSLEEPDISEENVDFDWDDEDIVVSNLTCVCIVGIEDPVRDEVPESIRICQKAGITVRMVTGDNVETARSIAEKCGIIPKGNKNFLVVEGPAFRKKVMTVDEKGEEMVNQEVLNRVWPRLRVLARSSPQDKHSLVNGIINSRINKNREVVAVTGDGTNDGPALKCADVGFAMGIAGTDVAKEACDIILTDDNFASIVKAVKWGRNVYDAIAKFLQFQLTVNVVAVSLVLVGAFSIGDTPLRVIQLLWVNLVMDTFGSLALATEPPTDELLKRKPYGRKKKLISRRMWLFILGHSVYQLITLITLLFAGPTLFDIEDGSGLFAEPTEHFTIIFNTFVFMQIFNEFNARKVHGERNVFTNIHTNYIFIGIVSLQVILQILWVEVPELNTRVFKTTHLTPDLWLWCLFLGSLELVWGQIITTIPVEEFPRLSLTFPPWKIREEEQQDDDDDDIDWEVDDNRARLLWIKSLNRLRAQIRVVNAFKAGLEANDKILLSQLPQYTYTPRAARYHADESRKDQTESEV